MKLDTIINPVHIELSNRDRVRLMPRFFYLLSYPVTIITAILSLALSDSIGASLQTIAYFIVLFAMLRACSLAKHSGYRPLAVIIWVGFALALMGGAL